MKKKKLKIEPLGDQIFLTIEKAALGALDTSSVKTGVEWGIIQAIGPDVQNKTLKIGDKVFVKSWGADIILFEGEDYVFTSEARKAICAIVE